MQPGVYEPVLDYHSTQLPGLAQPLRVFEDVFHLAGSMGKPDLDLMVPTPQEFYVAILQVTRQIAGTIDAGAMFLTERVGQETFGVNPTVMVSPGKN
jgi:hypothetical protein